MNMEILIWGDKMKRQVSVSIFLAILVLVLAWMYIRFSNGTKINENIITTENDVSQEQSVTISQEYISYPYYIKAEDGRLVVFETKTNTVFMESSIEISTLPLDVQAKLKTGIFFQNQGELFDFLESYSS